MTSLVLSEEQLRAKLAGKFDSEQIDAFIDQYDAATLDEKPNLDIIADLAKRGQEDKYLRVDFKSDKWGIRCLSNLFRRNTETGDISRAKGSGRVHSNCCIVTQLKNNSVWRDLSCDFHTTSAPPYAKRPPTSKRSAINCWCARDSFGNWGKDCFRICRWRNDH